ncbi:MAG: DUF695 domain-containing protein, partial [Oligoflexia bacterium]|nr:DUF695 domain-containing protein [Oligoflexia bacterium]
MTDIPAHFDYYLTTMADWPASVFLDLALAAHAPIPSLPQRLHVTASLKRPQADGLRSRTEADELHAMEDAVTRVVEDLGGRYVGRITWQGRSDAIFYVPSGVDDLSVFDAFTGDYDVVLRLEPDPTWGFYREFLLPNPYQHQTMLSRHTLQALQEHGDDLDAKRDIGHVFQCFTPPPLETLAGQLIAQHYRVDEIRRISDGTFALHAHRAESPA